MIVKNKRLCRLFSPCPRVLKVLCTSHRFRVELVKRRGSAELPPFP
ncbi:hypothetical protein ES705_31916 [subsurface metagenome]